VRSLIKTYALEGRGENGAPTGRFYLTQKEFSNAAREIVHTHLGFSGSRLDDYLSEHVPRVFNHFDNINKGYIVVEEAPQAYHMLL